MCCFNVFNCRARTNHSSCEVLVFSKSDTMYIASSNSLIAVYSEACVLSAISLPPSTCNPLTSLSPTLASNGRPAMDPRYGRRRRGSRAAGVQQPPPPPRAERPDYQQRPAQDLRQAIPYVMSYGHLSPEGYQREVATARLAL